MYIYVWIRREQWRKILRKWLCYTPDISFQTGNCDVVLQFSPGSVHVTIVAAKKQEVW